MSQGLVLTAPPNSKPGDDVAELLGIVHYVPPEPSAGMGEFIADPPSSGEKYDVDSWYRYGSAFPLGIPVEVTEKIDGASSKFSYQDGKLWAGSRNHYLKEADDCMFWRVMHQNEWLQRLCKQNPDCIVYGETFGNVQSLKYGAVGAQYLFRVFDILTPKGYMNHFEKLGAMKKAVVRGVFKTVWYDLLNIEPPERPDWTECYVPILYVGPYTPALIDQFVSGPSMIPGANHVREGIVIKPLTETWDQSVGRLILKAVSSDYLAKDKTA